MKDRNALRAENLRLKAENQGLVEKVATVDTLTSQLATTQKGWDADKLAWGTERALIGEGLTDQEGRDVALFHYGRTPEKDRPTLDAWLKGHRAAPDKAPKSLQPFLGTPVAGGGGGDGKPPVPGSTPPRKGDPETADAAHGEPASAAAIKAAREKGVKTNDWTEFNRLTGKDKRTRNAKK